MTKLNPNDYIQKYGGKAGGYFYLKDLGGFEKHLLPAVYLAAGQEVSEIEKDVEPLFSHSGKIIARGTHPGDHEGLVDVLRTEAQIKTSEELVKKVEVIRGLAKHELILAYAQYENSGYDGNIGILIQAMNTSRRRGSMVEHPHEKGTYIVDIVEEDRYQDNVDCIESLAVRDGKLWSFDKFVPFNEFSFMYPDKLITEKELESIIELYKAVRKTNFISPDISFQMEFGLQNDAPVLFYQARPFKKFEESTFTLKEFNRYECFGMTPEEGLILPIIKTPAGRTDKVNNQKEPFAWFQEMWAAPTNPSCQPKNMSVYVALHENRKSMLEHNVYRWIRKADVSIPFSMWAQHWSNTVEDGDKVRIISDGLCNKVKILK